MARRVTEPKKQCEGAKIENEKRPIKIRTMLSKEGKDQDNSSLRG